MDATAKPHVVIAGAGIAGLTAAFYLSRMGYHVTLYEAKSMVGGNLATRQLASGDPVDVYPHMFQGWYHNFWQLLADANVPLNQRFKSFSTVHQLRRLPPADSGELTTLDYPYSPRHLLQNLNSGVASPTDMLLFACATLDLLAEVKSPTVRLSNMSLTGYLNTRLYMTPSAIDAYETFIARVWALPAYQISAADCRTYSAYCYGAGEEPCWLTTSPAETAFLDAIKTALADTRRVNIVEEMRVDEVVLDARGCVKAIGVQETEWSPKRYEWVPRESGSHEVPLDGVLLLALPPKPLARLVRKGPRGSRIVDAIPELAELQRVGAQRVPVLHLRFRDQLDDIPAEPVGLAGSKLNLAFTDISKTWRGFGGQTVLEVSCSEPDMLPGPDVDDGFAIMKELREYIEFDLGDGWGKSPAIDWTRTRYHVNSDTQLALNAVGSERWRPAAWCEKAPNLFFAGDCCKNDFGITTVEAAVATGLAAVNEVVRIHGGDEVKIKIPYTVPNDEWVALRFAWLPLAYAAKGLTMAAGDEGGSADSGDDESLLHYLLTPGRPSRFRHPES